MTIDQDSGGQAAVETPKNDFVESQDPAQVEAPVKDATETGPKKAPIEDQDEGEADHEDTDQSEGKKRRRGGFQKKIERLQAEIAELRAGQQPKADVLPKADDATGDKPAPDKFETWGDYTEALTEWKANEVFRKAETVREQKSQEEAANKAFQAKVEKFEQGKETVRQANPDFDEALAEFDDVPINPAIRAALVESDMGAEIAYYLAKNPEAFEQLNAPTVDFVHAMKAFGKIEAKIEASKTSPVDIAAVKTSNAPPPIKPVAKGKSAGTGYSDDMSFEDFQVWERKQKNR